MYKTNKEWEKLREELKDVELEKDEYYMTFPRDYSDHYSSDEQKVLLYKGWDLRGRADFNGKVLNVGDTIIHVFGRHLRKSVITEILSMDVQFSSRIRVKGLKVMVDSLQCILVV